MCDRPAADRIVVVACGRRDCGDDAAGYLVGENLGQRDLPAVRVVLTESPGLDLIDYMLEGIELMVIVDAARASEQAPAGTWRKIDYHSGQGRLIPSRGGTHGLSIADALATAKNLGCLPAGVWIYAVFAEQFEFAAPMSDHVQKLIPEVAGAIQNDVNAFYQSFVSSAADADHPQS